MVEKQIRVGIIGAGQNTRKRHIPGFQNIPGVEVSCVCNRAEESSAKVAGAFGIPRTARSWEDVVNDPQVDAICIGTWPYMHATVCIAALDAGKHVLTEARMARNVAEAEQMLEASRRNPGLVAQVVPSPFTLTLDATIIRVLQEGRLGRLRQIVMEHRNAAYADPHLPMTWRQSFELSGVNTLTLGIYYEAVQRWMQEEPRSVRAFGQPFTKERRNPESGATEPVKIPELLSLHAEYESGLVLSGAFSGIESGPPRNEYRIHGDKGSLRVDVPATRLFIAKAGSIEEQELEIGRHEASDWRVEEDFIDSIRNGNPVRLTSFDQGLRYMRFTEAAYKSATAG